MSSITQLHNITPEELVSLIDQKVEQRLKKFKEELEQTKQEEELLTREQTAEFLQIHESTLWHWTKKGKLKNYSIAGKRYYKKNEVLEAMQT